MTSKSRDARRILSLFQHLHRMEVVRLSRLERRAAELEEEKRRLVSCLDGNDPFALAFADIVLKKIRSTTDQHRGIEQALEIQAKQAFAEARRVKLGEKLVGDLNREQQAMNKKTELREVVDHTVAPIKIRSP